MTNYRIENQDGTTRPLLLLHGTGGNEDDLIPIGKFLAPESPLLSIRGRLVENGMTRYFLHTPTGGFDLESLEKEAQWLLQEIDELATQFGLDTKELIPVGYSNGANVIIRTMLTKRVPFKTAVLFHPMSLGRIDQLLPQPQTAAWASFGTEDPIVSEENFAELKSDIELAGVSLDVYTHSEGHNLNIGELKAAQAWLKPHLTPLSKG